MGVATGPGATALIARRDWPPRGIAAGHGRGDRAGSHGSDRETGLAAAGDCGGAWAWRQGRGPRPWSRDGSGPRGGWRGGGGGGASRALTAGTRHSEAGGAGRDGAGEVAHATRTAPFRHVVT